MLEHIPTQEDILAAHKRISPYIHRTPVFTSHWFDERAGKHCIFKGEHLQKTGAFKARGAMNAALVNAEIARGKGYITHSSGNHGAALAWAAAQIGESAYIIMPENAPKTKVAAVRQYGGIITFCAPTLKQERLPLPKSNHKPARCSCIPTTTMTSSRDSRPRP